MQQGSRGTAYSKAQKLEAALYVAQMAGGKNAPEEKSRFENGGEQVPDNESPWASDG